MPTEQNTTEEITLPVGGSIPGIGGGPHGPGRYLVNWRDRTLLPIEDAAEQGIPDVAPPKKPTAPTAAEKKEK